MYFPQSPVSTDISLEALISDLDARSRVQAVSETFSMWTCNAIYIHLTVNLILIVVNVYAVMGTDKRTLQWDLERIFVNSKVFNYSHVAATAESSLDMNAQGELDIWERCNSHKAIVFLALIVMYNSFDICIFVILAIILLSSLSRQYREWL